MGIKYKQTISLNEDELAAKVNANTGNVEIVEEKDPYIIPKGKEYFESNATFKKEYSATWAYLNRVLNPLEYKAAHTLALMAKANTNSLEPLNDSTTLKELMEVLGVSINKVKPILKTLFNLGVYAGFEYFDVDKGYTKYWLFNPYLSFSGKLINSDIKELFKSTHIGKVFLKQK